MQVTLDAVAAGFFITIGKAIDSANGPLGKFKEKKIIATINENYKQLHELMAYAKHLTAKKNENIALTNEEEEAIKVANLVLMMIFHGINNNFSDVNPRHFKRGVQQYVDDMTPENRAFINKLVREAANQLNWDLSC